MAICFLLIALFSGVFITFLQPLVGKMVLPIFGGTALTWNSIVLLFYGFTFVTAVVSWGLMRFTTQRLQAMIQSLICLICFAIMGLIGITPEPSDQAVFSQMVVLGIKIAPVIFLSWGTVFLIHGWSQYHAFLSNRPLLIFATAYLGAALGLFMFHQFESGNSVSDLIFFVRVGFVFLVLLALLTLYPITRTEVAASKVDTQQKSPWLSWTLISFATSSLLLGFTHLAGSEFASSTIIWIVPMGLFALTLFVAFFAPHLIPSTPLFMGMLMTAIPLVMLELFSENIPTFTSVLVHGAFFATAVTYLHKHLGMLAFNSNLPVFFVCFTLGQFLAALFSVLAPMMFKNYVEYPMAIGLSVALATHFWSRVQNVRFLWRDFNFISLIVPCAVLGGVAWYVVHAGDKLSPQNMLLVCAAIASSLVLIARNQYVLFIAVTGLIVAPNFMTDNSILYKNRSFYGVSQVQNWGDYRLYTNGSTIHGAEALEDATPLTYYSEEGPIGHFFETMGTYISQWPVAVLGLGTGSVVQYMAAKQPVDFYEVDKLVEHIAKTYFSFIKKSDAIVDVKIGDGRVELQKAPESHYGFILMDAFSSDAIPSHLLTKEAFKMYLTKLRPDGIIIVNIANRYVNLYPMLRSLAKDLNLSIARGSSTVENKAKLIYPSEWVAFSPAAGRLDALNATKIWQTDNLDGITHASWKDDFIDIRSILRK